MGPPRPGFNAGLRRLCTEHGALLVLDEVMTGFRVSAAGWWGLEGAVEGWAPDLMTFGKVMGGGLPTAAFGGSAALMSHLAPAGAVYQAGTLSGNPIATAAGLATLDGCTPEVYDHLDRVSAQVGQMVSEALTKEGVPHRVQRAGNLFSVFFTSPDAGTGPVTDYDSARRQDSRAYAVFFHAMLANGVYLPPSGFEAWFVSAAHDQAALDRIADALPAAARAAAQATDGDSAGGRQR